MTDRRAFLAAVAAIAVLAGLDKPVPGILENVAVGCLTGLAGLLARGPQEDRPEVVIRQPAGEPVPVEDAKT